MTRAASFEPYSYRRDPSVPAFDDTLPIIVFDGHCAMCSGFVRFVLRHDRARRFRFLAAQSPLGEALYRHYGLKSGDYETNLLLIDGEVRRKSDGSIKMFEILGLPWSLLSVGRALPRPWRDALYDLIARNRFRWFGRREQCFAPSPRDAARFLQ